MKTLNIHHVFFFTICLFIMFGTCCDTGYADDVNTLDKQYGNESEEILRVAWSAAGEVQAMFFGYSVAGAGDVNKDGYDDIVIGAREYSIPGSGGGAQGKAFVYLGGSEGLQNTPVWSDTGNTSYDWFGTAVAGIGDVNKDGFDDIAIGTEEWINGDGFREGRVYVYYGSPTGPSPEPSWIGVGPVNNPNSYLGGYVAAAGDVNKDGYDDLVAGLNSTVAPKAYLYYGSENGLSQTPDWIGDRSAVSGVGDVNGDGFVDVLCGTYFDYGYGAKVLLYYGSQQGPSLFPDWTLNATLSDGPRFGRNVSRLGDVNHDGYADVLIAADGQSAGGAALAFYGTANGLGAQPDWIVKSEDTTHGHMGRAVAGAGDVNDDGYEDALVTESIIDGADDKLSKQIQEMSSVFLYLGTAHGLYTLPNQKINCQTLQTACTTFFGLGIAKAGDVNGDGVDDVIIGDPWDGSNGSTAGRVFVFHGTPRSQEGNNEGETEGSLEGAGEGLQEGSDEGQAEGIAEGETEGQEEGVVEGQSEGETEGIIEGQPEGQIEGIPEGSIEGQIEGLPEGQTEGLLEGQEEGLLEGEEEGESTIQENAQKLIDSFTAIDEDLSNDLSLEEVHNLFPLLSQATFSLIDSNQDGKLSLEELESAISPVTGCNISCANGKSFPLYRFLGDFMMMGLSLLVLIEMSSILQKR